MTDQETKPLISYSDSLKLMGNQSEYTAAYRSLKICKYAITKGIEGVKRREQLLSTYSDNSITTPIK